MLPVYQKAHAESGPLSLVPVEQYHQGLQSAMQGTDQYKSMLEYQQSLAPTQQEQARMQELQNLFQNTDQYQAYETFGQSMSKFQAQQRPSGFLQSQQPSGFLQSQQQPSVGHSHNDLLKGLGELFEKYFSQNQTPQINNQENIFSGQQGQNQVLTSPFGNIQTPYDRQF